MSPEIHLANGHAHHPGPPTLVRRMLPGDIAWALELADELYHGGIDKRLLAEWGERIMAHPNYLAIRSVSAVVIAAAVPEAFDAGVLNARALYFYGRDIWQVVRLLRIAAAWAKGMGAPCFRLEDATGRDISGIARRLKAIEDPVPVFVMEF
jgi:hypothetical protein